MGAYFIQRKGWGKWAVTAVRKNRLTDVEDLGTYSSLEKAMAAGDADWALSHFGGEAEDNPKQKGRKRKRKKARATARREEQRRGKRGEGFSRTWRGVRGAPYKQDEEHLYTWRPTESYSLFYEIRGRPATKRAKDKGDWTLTWVDMAGSPPERDEIGKFEYRSKAERAARDDWALRAFGLTAERNPKQGFDHGKAFKPPWYKQASQRTWQTSEEVLGDGHFSYYKARWLRKKRSYSLYRMTRKGWGYYKARWLRKKRSVFDKTGDRSEFLGRYPTSRKVVEAAEADWTLRQIGGEG